MRKTFLLFALLFICSFAHAEKFYIASIVSSSNDSQPAKYGAWLDLTDRGIKIYERNREEPDVTMIISCGKRVQLQGYEDAVVYKYIGFLLDDSYPDEARNFSVMVGTLPRGVKFVELMCPYYNMWIRYVLK